MIRKLCVCAGLALMASQVPGAYVETNHLVGVHFASDQNSTGGVAAQPLYTDLERMLGDSGGPEDSTNIVGDGGAWDLEVAVVDVNDANAPFYQWAWQGGVFGGTDKTQPGYMYYHIRRATQGGKNHTPIVRIQPAYGRNVPHPSDPYTNANYAADSKACASLMKDLVRYYVVGNEVNLASGENYRFTSVDGSGNHYNTAWSPTPEDYADTYIAVRDGLASATIGSAGAPVALMQAVSPGSAGTDRSYDGNEFLYRMIKRVNSVDPNKIQGFALHGYAEPGGPDYGTEGFWDSIREQLCIIQQLGHGNKPVFITEFNKHMPNATEHQVAINFIKRAYATIYDWNTGTGGTIPGVSNTNIVGTNWFVFPSSGPNLGDGWNVYSLQYWKSITASPNANNNVWSAFQQVATGTTTNTLSPFRYPRGKYGGGASWPANSLWWKDDFNGNALDTAPILPDWYPSAGSGGSYSVAGGKVNFFGNGNQFGNADVRTGGYAFGDFAMDIKFTFANAAKAATNSPEANFDIRLRENSSGYSLTFFSTPSPTNSGHIVLRRTGLWTTIGAFDVAVPGGINTGDTFEVQAVADGDNLNIKAYKNGSASPVMNWNVNDPTGQKAGGVRFGTYAINQVDVDYFAMGGKNWTPIGPTAARDWTQFE
jgi:hypothetical protein